ncbi:hypothetical protein [Methylobacterium sp. E-066]|uniref:hypothetical protein n=1 Tax=Methylobacterium sp. E-066 TaxID=2836584 RepID=UPI001FBBA161|nr:hypothetical protein [Methylobacterium sp. E-066]MCJ2144348.1 hypothetical protein [Methylobacterium sp. E-066]
MIKEDKLFSKFAAIIRDDHSEDAGSICIWGAPRDVDDYDALARDAGFPTRLFTKREEFLNELGTTTTMLAAVILRDRLSQTVQRAIEFACERLNPLYVIRLHSYITFEEDTRRIGIVTDYSHLIQAETPAAQRVLEATRGALRRAGESWKATESSPEAADQ